MRCRSFGFGLHDSGQGFSLPVVLAVYRCWMDGRVDEPTLTFRKNWLWRITPVKATSYTSCVGFARGFIHGFDDLQLCIQFIALFKDT